MEFRISQLPTSLVARRYHQDTTC
uniref:Uncharacterized protein n=1 Tax=Arundo donax TaxID=35708 RepID=A0A0A9ATC3_ARUDO